MTFSTSCVMCVWSVYVHVALSGMYTCTLYMYVHVYVCMECVCSFNGHLY